MVDAAVLEKIRYFRALIEFETAEANMELARYGEWKSDHTAMVASHTHNIQALLNK